MSATGAQQVQPRVIQLLAVTAVLLVAFLLRSAGPVGGAQTPDDATPAATPDTSLFDLEDVVGALVSAGLSVEPTVETVEQPFLEVPGQIVRVDGADAQVFLYSSAAEREADLELGENGAFDPGDGLTIDWVAEPRAYAAGNALVLFVSDDAALAAAIELGLGTLVPEPGPVVTPVPGAVVPGEARTLEDVIGALEAAGLTVTDPGSGPRDSFFAVPAHDLLVNDQPFEVYVYPTAADRVAETVMIRGDGSEVGPVIIDWIAPPHWTAANNVLTLLITADAALAETVAEAILTLA